MRFISFSFLLQGSARDIRDHEPRAKVHVLLRVVQVVRARAAVHAEAEVPEQRRVRDQHDEEDEVRRGGAERARQREKEAAEIVLDSG